MSAQRQTRVGWIALLAVAAIGASACNGWNPFKPSSDTTSTSTSTTTASTGSSSFAITAATASADNTALSVTCPGTVTFSTNLTSNKDGVIAYKWERSDGSATATETLTFPSATTLTASNSWKVTATTSGWQRLHVVTPNDLTSNAVNFTVTCK